MQVDLTKEEIQCVLKALPPCGPCSPQQKTAIEKLQYALEEHWHLLIHRTETAAPLFYIDTKSEPGSVKDARVFSSEELADFIKNNLNYLRRVHKFSFHRIDK